MPLLRSIVFVVFFALGCSPASSTGSGGGSAGGGTGASGGGSGGSGGSTSGAFLVPRSSDTANPQMMADASGTIHFIAAPGKVGSDGHTNVLYGQCKSNCAVPGSWSYLTVADGFTTGDYMLTVEPGGTVHIALFERLKAVTFGRCSTNCTSANGGWSFEKVTAPVGQDWTSLPKGRSLAVSSTGLERLFVNSTGGVIVVARTATGYTANPVATGNVAAMQVLAKGDGLQIVARVEDTLFSMAYAECTQGCDDAANYVLGTFTHANSALVAAARASDGTLHAVFASSLGQANPNTDLLLWSRCSANCTMESSWQQVSIGDGNGARGSLDLAIRSDGTFGLTTAKPTDTLHSVEFRTCAAGCSSAAAWTQPVQADRTGDVMEPPPQVTTSCQPTYVWSVGDAAQIAPNGNGFVLAYSAHILLHCPASPADQYTSIGSYVRLKGM